MYKKILLFFVAIIIGLGHVVSAQQIKHVVVISIDGFRPDFYRDTKWATSNIKQLARDGVSADYVRCIFPSVTYPSHSTMITGCLPANTGVFYNTTINENGLPGGWVYDSTIKAETLWEAAKKAGLTTASVSWPISVDADCIDYNIPEFWSFKNPMDRRGATSEHANPKGLFEEAVEHATGKMEINDFNLTSLNIDDNLSRIAGYILRTYKPNLLTLHLPCTDGAQHLDGRDGDMVERAIAGADHAVSYLRDALEKAGIINETAIIVTGDHGFVSVHTRISPNVWLKNAGIIGSDESDWKARFFSVGGAAFLQMKDTKDTQSVEKVKEILAQLPLSKRQMFKVIDRKQMDNIKANPNSPLAITAARGYCFSNNADGPVLLAKRGGAHGYYPDFQDISTGFVVCGPGINKGMKLQQICLEDIAPIVAKMLGISLPNADGKVVSGIFESKKK